MEEFNKLKDTDQSFVNMFQNTWTLLMNYLLQT